MHALVFLCLQCGGLVLLGNLGNLSYRIVEGGFSCRYSGTLNSLKSG
jgi:hypothetical protein